MIRIDGQLVQVGFLEGQHVRKGDFLTEIDPRPYQAALEQAEGQLARIRRCCAMPKSTSFVIGLVAEDSIARQTLDTQESLVRQYRATNKVDQGQVDSARLNLGFFRIVSPVEGRVGLRQVDEGNYVQTSDTSGIVVVTQLRPITEGAVRERRRASSMRW
jgi:multidrug efflux system membrane fusion protein